MKSVMMLMLFFGVSAFAADGFWANNANCWRDASNPSSLAAWMYVSGNQGVGSRCDGLYGGIPCPSGYTESSKSCNAYYYGAPSNQTMIKAVRTCTAPAPAQSLSRPAGGGSGPGLNGAARKAAIAPQ